MVRVNCWVALRDAVSVTRTLNVNVPALAGVPEITPLNANNVRPPGSEPADKNQRYAGVPPTAVRVTLYPAPTDPLGNVVDVVIARLEATLMVNCLVAVTEALSVTCTVKLNTPDAEGEPPIEPPAFSVRPGCREP